MHTNCISSLGINMRFLFTTSVIITRGSVKIRQEALTSLELKFSVGMLHNIAHRQLMVLLVLLTENPIMITTKHCQLQMKRSTWMQYANTRGVYCVRV